MELCLQGGSRTLILVINLMVLLTIFYYVQEVDRFSKNQSRNPNTLLLRIATWPLALFSPKGTDIWVGNGKVSERVEYENICY